MKRRWSKKGQEPPAGAVRRSQLITTYGAGAMVDLVDHAVLIAGLDYWNYGDGRRTPIIEPRLSAALVTRFRKHGVMLNPRATLFPPPDCDDDDPNERAGIQVVEFPRWMVCKGCSAMVQASPSLQKKQGRYQHACTSGKPSLLVPVRFVAVCPDGHVDEFPWIDFVHFGSDTECRSSSLLLREDAGGELYDVRVTCAACDTTQSMSQASSLDQWYQCRGSRPWLGTGHDVREACEHKMRMKVRTSSSTYFAQHQSALSIPDKSARLEKLVQRHLPSLSEAKQDNLAQVIELNPPVRRDLGSYGLDHVWATLQMVRDGGQPLPAPMKTTEYEYVQGVPVEEAGDCPDEEELAASFFARRLRPRTPLPVGVDRVVLIRQLREVRAQVGFTRLAPIEANLEGDFGGKVRTAALGHLTDWLPAIEERGEGLWIQLDTERLAAWEARPAVQRRARDLENGWDLAIAAGGQLGELPFFGPRYYMLHALSHLLIQAIALECGYGASSIRERIYCSMPGAATSMAAILLSTTTPGSEGTLGGLVAQGRRLDDHLARALAMGRLCSNDPVCATHRPGHDPAERHLEGAACHGCLYLAEVSCERMNRMLDRALVVPVIDQPEELAFFAAEP